MCSDTEISQSSMMVGSVLTLHLFSRSRYLAVLVLGYICQLGKYWGFGQDFWLLYPMWLLGKINKNIPLKKDVFKNILKRDVFINVKNIQLTLGIHGGSSTRPYAGTEICWKWKLVGGIRGPLDTTGSAFWSCPELCDLRESQRVCLRHVCFGRPSEASGNYTWLPSASEHFPEVSEKHFGLHWGGQWKALQCRFSTCIKSNLWVLNLLMERECRLFDPFQGRIMPKL